MLTSALTTVAAGATRRRIASSTVASARSFSVLGKDGRHKVKKTEELREEIYDHDNEPMVKVRAWISGFVDTRAGAPLMHLKDRPGRLKLNSSL